jgi:hypothetical protein
VPGLRLQLEPPEPQRPKIYTRKRWIKDLLEKRDAVERAIGMPLGEMLGCGHYGCVFRSEGPWVVKLTVDKTEGPIWASILDVLDETPELWGGLSRIKQVVRLTPDVGRGRRKRKLYAIVREECEPLAHHVPVLAGLMSTYLTDYTRNLLGMPSGEWSVGDVEAIAQDEDKQDELYGAALLENQRQDDAVQMVREVIELGETLDGLNEYRWAAQSLHQDIHEFGISRQFVEATVEELFGATARMVGWVGEPLGRTLEVLGHAGIYLRDVHELNIGWRIHETIGGDVMPQCLVVYDPGHTPTAQKTEIEERMIANARWEG